MLFSIVCIKYGIYNMQFDYHVGLVHILYSDINSTLLVHLYVPSSNFFLFRPLTANAPIIINSPITMSSSIPTSTLSAMTGTMRSGYSSTVNGIEVTYVCTCKPSAICGQCIHLLILVAF